MSIGKKYPHISWEGRQKWEKLNELKSRFLPLSKINKPSQANSTFT